jgi:hypothetical protein
VGPQVRNEQADPASSKEDVDAGDKRGMTEKIFVMAGHSRRRRRCFTTPYVPAMTKKMLVTIYSASW